jgi:hypothetical protein
MPSTLCAAEKVRTAEHSTSTAAELITKRSHAQKILKNMQKMPD